MFSSQNKENGILFSIYNDSRSVFRLKDIAMLSGEINFISLNKKINYLVRTGKLKNLRKGIYAKQPYSLEELAGRIFSPSYISFEYVLQQAGIIFQYNSEISCVSYLSRKLEIDSHKFNFKKIKSEILVDNTGIIQKENGVFIASPERAFLDMLYLSKEYYFDNISLLNKDLIYKILPIYQSKVLQIKTAKLLNL